MSLIAQSDLITDGSNRFRTFSQMYILYSYFHVLLLICFQMFQWHINKVFR